MQQKAAPRTAMAVNRTKKSPRSEDPGLNPPKEEGGGDNRGMSRLLGPGSEPPVTLARVFPLQSRLDIQ
jgi:hypothetical protein